MPHALGPKPYAQTLGPKPHALSPRSRILTLALTLTLRRAMT